MTLYCLLPIRKKMKEISNCDTKSIQGEEQMNKTAIKNFAICARNKLIADITYKAGLLGITEKETKNPLPQST